jgi:hypothetical protein
MCMQEADGGLTLTLIDLASLRAMPPPGAYLDRFAGTAPYMAPEVGPHRS